MNPITFELVDYKGGSITVDENTVRGGLIPEAA
jgi:hypothetical protein